jgi:uncharacterized protein YndB with AHSA1/START domain
VSAQRKPASVTDHELVIERVFNAPRNLVWAAWTDPKHSLKWMGPVGVPAIDVQSDLRVGGKWQLTLQRADNGQKLPQGGVYREIVPNERLVYTFEWDGDGAEMLITITFADAGVGKTRMVFRQSNMASQAEVEGHRVGWSSTFDRLEAQFAEGSIT